MKQRPDGPRWDTRETVFACLAIMLLIAAASVTQLGPEAKQKGLDEIAAPTG